MNTELQAMIDAGRKLIAEQATAEQRKAAEARLKALLYIEGHVNGAVLYSMAADEIESLRAQVEDQIAGALVRAHRQCIAVEALTVIRDMETNEEMRRIAQRAVAQIEAVTR